jgi:hypothetical protein
MSVSIAFRIMTEIGIIHQLGSTLFERDLPDNLTMPQFGVLGRSRRIAMTAAGRKARERAIKSVAHHIAEIEREIGVRALEGALPLLTKMRTFLDQRRGEN